MSVVSGFNNNKEIYDKEKIKNVSFEEFIGEELVALDAFLNIGDARKRSRPMGIVDLFNNQERDLKIRKKANKRGRRTARQSRQIVGRNGMGPVNCMKMAQEIKVEISLMDLFRMSTDLSKAFRKLSTRVNEREVKEIIKKEIPATVRVGKVSSIAGSEVLFGRMESSLKGNADKAFRVLVVVRTVRNGKPMRVSLPLGMSRADQGSDMIIVIIGFLKKLGLLMKSLVERGYNGLTVNVADGSLANLTHSKFEIGVCEVWRKVEAFVRL